MGTHSRVLTSRKGGLSLSERPPFLRPSSNGGGFWDSLPLAREGHLAIFTALMTMRDPRIRAASDERPGDEDGTGLGLATKTRTRTKSPSPYKVLMLNDDYTPMEFVVHVLQSFFKMSIEDATRVMLHVHQRGVGVCGIFPYEVAETKVAQVIDFARANQHPLQCTLEKA